MALAEENYMKALALNSMDGQLYVKVAGFYSDTGRPALAETYLLKVVRKYPYFQQYKLALAQFYTRQGRDKEAIETLEASNQFLKNYAPLNPVRLDVLSWLAALYKDRGDSERSEEFAAKARRLAGLTDGSSDKGRKGP